MLAFNIMIGNTQALIGDISHYKIPTEASVFGDFGLRRLNGPIQYSSPPVYIKIQKDSSSLNSNVLFFSDNAVNPYKDSIFKEEKLMLSNVLIETIHRL